MLNNQNLGEKRSKKEGNSILTCRSKTDAWKQKYKQNGKLLALAMDPMVEKHWESIALWKLNSNFDV